MAKRKIREMIKWESCLAGMLLAALFLTGCGEKKVRDLPVVQVSLWTDERNFPVLDECLNEFQELHKEEAVFDFAVSMEREDTCKVTVLNNPPGAADIFTFADDQFEELYRGGALLELTEGVDEMVESVGGPDSGAAGVVMRDGKAYAYPVVAGNGYFLYYNKAYLSEEDVLTLDGILETAGRKGKKFTMDFSSGWYLYSFFKGAGLDLESLEDGTANVCNWNATDTEPYKGVDVAEAMLAVTAHRGFVSLDDEGFLRGVRDGSVIAGVNGAWNAANVEEAWGEDYMAAKLPTYTIAGDQVQMCSFAGYKLIGVNAYTKEPEWSMKLASFLTSKENQLKRFKITGECPVCVEAAQMEEVQSAPAVAALAAQSRYGYLQSVAEPFWMAASKLGITLAAGNLNGKNLQELLDAVQKEIVSPSDLNE